LFFVEQITAAGDQDSNDRRDVVDQIIVCSVSSHNNVIEDIYQDECGVFKKQGCMNEDARILMVSMFNGLDKFEYLPHHDHQHNRNAYAQAVFK
jgi:hypothetical protein